MPHCMTLLFTGKRAQSHQAFQVCSCGFDFVKCWCSGWKSFFKDKPEKESHVSAILQQRWGDSVEYWHQKLFSSRQTMCWCAKSFQVLFRSSQFLADPKVCLCIPLDSSMFSSTSTIFYSSKKKLSFFFLMPASVWSGLQFKFCQLFPHRFQLECWCRQGSRHFLWESFVRNWETIFPNTLNLTQILAACVLWIPKFLASVWLREKASRTTKQNQQIQKAQHQFIKWNVSNQFLEKMHLLDSVDLNLFRFNSCLVGTVAETWNCACNILSQRFSCQWHPEPCCVHDDLRPMQELPALFLFGKAQWDFGLPLLWNFMSQNMDGVLFIPLLFLRRVPMEEQDKTKRSCCFLWKIKFFCIFFSLFDKQKMSACVPRLRRN